MSKTKSLDPTDWIKAAFRALTAGGPEAVRVEKLARDLGVTKGSFYWHFEDLPALQAAMLAHWQDVATGHVIAQAEEAGTGLETLLTGLLTEAASGQCADYGGPLAEAAIREWARSHAGAADAVAGVDARRLSFLQKKFEDRGFAPSVAGQRAALFYATLVGAELLSATAALYPETIEAFTRGLLRDNEMDGPTT
jgi:AcrR family transcriptional regulator